MRFVDLIEKKAEGFSLSDEEIRTMITGYVNGDIPDYQMSAMAMAILQRGMTPHETAALTMEMMHSGDVADLSDIKGIKVDKHSTGGVGDTTTLVVAPLVAACGGTVAKMSGRGLGHTGGTLDKLESIPGCRVELPIGRFKDIVNEIGVAVIGQTGNLVPADKKLYALRDVTATVRSIPLIASSIMSKKLASGADAIVLDVKTGSGAFMRTKNEAFELAKLMVDIGALTGRKVSAFVTDMDQPLGMAVGNALEVQEAVELLSGNVPASDPLFEVCILLGEQMLLMSGLAEENMQARKMLIDAVKDGSGLKKLQRMVEMQGGDASYLTSENMHKLVTVRRRMDVTAAKAGYIHSMNAEKIGTAAQMLGAGRASKTDDIDPAVGLVMKVRRGDRVEAGGVLADLYINDEKYLDDAVRLLQEAIVIDEEEPDERPMVYGLITK
ncbi:MAG: pyrimidine-nucleoside phosphorylase [Solobacterium sp.]|nr:pyrimidine-nucleoside phosphorylase [Solobacterium sp.]